MDKSFEPDPRQAMQFLKILDPKAREFDYRLIWQSPRSLPSGQKRVIKKRDSLRSVSENLTLANQQGYGVFVTVSETNGRGVKAVNVTRIRSVFADLDAGLPPSWPLPPTMVVNTSPGKYQVYWCVTDDMAPGEFAAVMERLGLSYGADKAAKDIARVLRLPGFYHTKAKPYLVHISENSGRRYTTAELTKAFPPAPKRHPKKAKRSPAEFDAALAADALSVIPVDIGKQRSFLHWFQIGAALFHASGGSDEGFNCWVEWSRKSRDFDLAELRKEWASIAEGSENRERGAVGGAATMGTIIWQARQRGWRPPYRPPVLAELQA